MTKDFGARRYAPSNKKYSQKIKNLKLEELLSHFSFLKRVVISKMFWGRSSFYKNIVHFAMVGITVIIALSGIASRIAVAGDDLYASGTASGSEDLLPQGGNMETVLVSTSEIVTPIIHVVAPGESLKDIADSYRVSTDTVRWYNQDLISPFTDSINIGWELKIPSSGGIAINGILYTVRTGQTLEDIVKATNIGNSGSTISNIIQFNNLPEPYTLEEGQKLFIPDGNISTSDIKVTGIPTGVFINPLSHPACSGYTISRGFLPYHNGVDLPMWPGCPIEAVAAGTVSYAGWSPAGEGYNVRIDHGGGISTHYYHGNGDFGVKVGDRVQQGQYIMTMGTSGNSTGIHLHFSLLKNGVFVNPYGYVPY